jgi:hypothetical protein
LTIEIRIVGDGDDTGMVSRTPVQRDIVSAIACQDGAGESCREGKLVVVAKALIRSPSLQGSKDIVA